MPDWNLVARQHVMAAMAEYDDLGSKEFLRRYGFRRSITYTLWQGGREYDSKAILGAAYFHATGRPATWDEFSGGEKGAAKVLGDMGFDLVASEEPVAPTRTRKAAPAKPRKAPVRETAPKLCPRCFVALPATGICDFCD